MARKQNNTPSHPSISPRPPRRVCPKPRQTSSSSIYDGTCRKRCPLPDAQRTTTAFDILIPPALSVLRFSGLCGQVGPAQASGLICVGDVLVAVGGDRVKGLSFPSILGELYHTCACIPWEYLVIVVCFCRTRNGRNGHEGVCTCVTTSTLGDLWSGRKCVSDVTALSDGRRRLRVCQAGGGDVLLTIIKVLSLSSVLEEWDRVVSEEFSDAVEGKPQQWVALLSTL